jgi:hypothetical protein
MGSWCKKYDDVINAIKVLSFEGKVEGSGSWVLLSCSIFNGD